MNDSPSIELCSHASVAHDQAGGAGILGPGVSSGCMSLWQITVSLCSILVAPRPLLLRPQALALPPPPGRTAADHGLYRQLDDAFRLEYAGLWHSLVFAGERLAGQVGSEVPTPGSRVAGLSQRLALDTPPSGAIGAVPAPPALVLRMQGASADETPAASTGADEGGIRRHSAAMNAGDAVPLFAGMLTQKPWEEVTQKGSSERLKLKYTEEEKEAIQVGEPGLAGPRIAAAAMQPCSSVFAADRLAASCALSRRCRVGAEFAGVRVRGAPERCGSRMSYTAL